MRLWLSAAVCAAVLSVSMGAAVTVQGSLVDFPCCSTCREDVLAYMGAVQEQAHPIQPSQLEAHMGEWCVQYLAWTTVGKHASPATFKEHGIASQVESICHGAAYTFHLGHFGRQAEAHAFCQAVDTEAVRAVVSGEAGLERMLSAVSAAQNLGKRYVEATLSSRVRPSGPVEVITADKECAVNLEALGMSPGIARLRCGILHDGTSIMLRSGHDAAVKFAEERYESLAKFQEASAELRKLQQGADACTSQVKSMWRAGRKEAEITEQEALCELLSRQVSAVQELASYASDALARTESASAHPADERRSERGMHAHLEVKVADARVHLLYSEIAVQRGVINGLPSGAMTRLRREVNMARELLRTREDELGAQSALRTHDDEAIELREQLARQTDPVERLRLANQLATLQQQVDEIHAITGHMRDEQRLYEDMKRWVDANPADPDVDKVRQRLADLRTRLHASDDGSATSDKCFSCRSMLIMVMETAQAQVGSSVEGLADYMRHYCYAYLHVVLGDALQARPLCENLHQGLQSQSDPRYLYAFYDTMTTFCRAAGRCYVPTAALPGRGPETPCEHCASQVIGAVEEGRHHARRAHKNASHLAVAAAEAQCRGRLESVGSSSQHTQQLCSVALHPPGLPARFSRPDNTSWSADLADSLELCRAVGSCSLREARELEVASAPSSDDPLAAEAHRHAVYQRMAQQRAALEQQAAQLREGVDRAQEELKHALHEAADANTTVVLRARDYATRSAAVGAVHALVRAREHALREMERELKAEVGQVHGLVASRDHHVELTAQLQQDADDKAVSVEAVRDKTAELVAQRVHQLVGDDKAELSELRRDIAELTADMAAQPSGDVAERLGRKQRELENALDRIAQAEQRAEQEVAEQLQLTAQQVQELRDRRAAAQAAAEAESQQIRELRPRIDETTRAVDLARIEASLMAEAEVRSQSDAEQAHAAFQRAVDDLIRLMAKEAGSEQALADSAVRLEEVAGATGIAAPRSSVYWSVTVRVAHNGALEGLEASVARRQGVEASVAQLLDTLPDDVTVTDVARCPSAEHHHRASGHKFCTDVSLRAVLDANLASRAVVAAPEDWVNEGAWARALVPSDAARAEDKTEAWIPERPSVEALAPAEEHSGTARGGSDDDAARGSTVRPVSRNECTLQVLAARDSASATAASYARSRDLTSEQAVAHAEGARHNATVRVCERIAVQHQLPRVVDVQEKCTEFVSEWPEFSDDSTTSAALAEQFCSRLRDLSVQYAGTEPSVGRGISGDARHALPAAPRDYYTARTCCTDDVDDQYNMGNREPYQVLRSELPEGARLSQAQLHKPLAERTPLDVDALTQSFVRGNTHTPGAELAL